MSEKFRRVLAARKPAIAMVHLGALPGAPPYDPTGGSEALVEAAWKDLNVPQKARVDAVMFGNENDRPYEFEVDTASTATMAYVIGRLRERITLPFGVNVQPGPPLCVRSSPAPMGRARRLKTLPWRIEAAPR